MIFRRANALIKRQTLASSSLSTVNSILRTQAALMETLVHAMRSRISQFFCQRLRTMPTVIL
jgi:hypothetical protein